MTRWLGVVAAGALLACGGGDVSSEAGPTACAPVTCASRGASCGAVDDGCGGTLDCGGCPAALTCGGGGVPNVCGYGGGCQRTTCEAAGTSCGSVPDGCGGTLACGSCPDGQTCGGGGTANVCAAPPAAGEPVWSMAVSTPGTDWPLDAGTDARGNRYLLSQTRDDLSGASTLRLQRLSPAGAVTLSREWDAVGFPYSNGHFRMAVAADGSTYVAVSAICGSWEPECVRSIDLGAGTIVDSALVKLGPDGRVAWSRALPGRRIESIATGGAAEVAIGSWPSTGGGWTLDRFDRDGAFLASLGQWAPDVAFDPAGDLIVPSWGGVRKVAADGSFHWERALPGAGSIDAVAAAADGAIVVLAQRTGDVEFGPSTVRAGTYVVYVLEGDGRPRFARGLSTGSPILSVDPAGRVAIVGGESCGHLVVEAFDLANADLWRQDLTAGAVCWPGVGAGPAAYGADHRLFVAGQVWQTADVAGTRLVPRGQDVFGVLLGP